MHPNPSLANGSLQDAIDALAQRAVALRHGAPRMSKEAMDKTAFLGQLGSQLQDSWKNLDPAAQKALLGAGIGGVAGLGSSLFQDKEDRRPLSSAMTGALAGGALGGGLGMLNKFTQPGSVPELPPEKPSRTFTSPSGQEMKFKSPPTPEQIEKIKKLTEGTGTAEGASAAMATGGALTAAPFAVHRLYAGPANTVVGTQSRNRSHLVNALGRGDINSQIEKVVNKGLTTTTGGEVKSVPINAAALTNWLSKVRKLSDTNPRAFDKFVQGTHVDFNHPELGAGRRAMLQHLMGVGAAQEVGADAASATLRESGLHNALNRRGTRWLSKFINPHVNVSTRLGRWRGRGKAALPFAVGAGLAEWGRRAYNSYADRAALEDTLKDLAEPVQ